MAQLNKSRNRRYVMTEMDGYAAALQDMSVSLLAIAATETRWDCEALRAYARDLDQIALELLIEEDTESAWSR